MKLTICKICGKEYDAHTYGKNGVVGMTLSYCSDKCRLEGRRANERKKNQRKKQELIALRTEKGSKKPVSLNSLITKFGPRQYNSQCFGCPLLGWDCRMKINPPCNSVLKFRKLMDEYRKDDVYA